MKINIGLGQTERYSFLSTLASRTSRVPVMIREQSYEESEICDNIDRYVKNYFNLQPIVSRSHIFDHTRVAFLIDGK